MLLEITLALLLGILFGTFTGLAPGIHINLVAAILLSSLSYLIGVPAIALAVFIASMSVTHTFLDFIPSIFLGAPEEDTFLSILPGHEMLRKGSGYEACVLTLYGSLIALPIIILFSPLFVSFLPDIYSLVQAFIPYLLIFLSFYLIFTEKNVVSSFLVFMLAGFLGFAAFQLPAKDPLLPLLTGLFGISSLVLSIKNKISLKKQITPPLREIKLSKSEFLKASFSAALVAPLCSFLPGIGSGHAATLASEFLPQKRKGFLFLTGAVSTIIMALSFVTVYSIGRARSGSAAAVKSLLNEITLQHLIIILVSIVIAGIFSFFLGVFISQLFAKNINKINYGKLSLFVIAFLFIINIIFALSSPLGLVINLLILICSTSLGIFCVLSDSRRINLMGALIVPAISYYLMN